MDGKNVCLTLVTSTILLMVVLIVFNSCSKNDESPTDWQEDMNGKILFTQNYFTPGIQSERLYSIDEQGLKSITSHGNYETITGAGWSGGGKQIIYVSQGTQLKIIKSDGTGERLILEHGKGINDVVWPHDWIAFAGSTHIYLSDSLGLIHDSLSLEGSNCQTLDWHATTNRIVFSVSPINSRILIWNLDTHTTRNLSESLKFPSHPAWSPDGSQISFQQEDSNGLSQVFICNSDGTNIKQLTYFSKENPSENFYVMQSSWSPHDDLIAIGTTRGVYVVNLQGELKTHIPLPHGGDMCATVDWF